MRDGICERERCRFEVEAFLTIILAEHGEDGEITAMCGMLLRVHRPRLLIAQCLAVCVQQGTGFLIFCRPLIQTLDLALMKVMEISHQGPASLRIFFCIDGARIFYGGIGIAKCTAVFCGIALLKRAPKIVHALL